MKTNITELPVIQSQSDHFLDKLEIGDLLFCSGKYFTSRMIEKVTQSKWSHLGILIKMQNFNYILLLESVVNVGVRLVPITKYTENYENGKPYEGELVVARFAGLTPEQSKSIVQFGFSLLGFPYDTDEIVKILFRVVSGEGIMSRDQEFTCAELVYECFLRAGIELSVDARGFISPESIWQDPRLMSIGRLVLNKEKVVSN